MAAPLCLTAGAPVPGCGSLEQPFFCSLVDWTGLDWGLALVACLVDSGADPHITGSTFGCGLVQPGRSRQGIGLHKRQLRAAWAAVLGQWELEL
jgi:hypothetical protein